MIIHHPELRSKNGRTFLSARIEYRQSPIPLPEILYYDFPQAHENHIPLRGDAFLIATLLTAMVLDEDIEVHGPVSPKLVYGLNEYQKIFVIWFPKMFSTVRIKTIKLEPLPHSRVQGDTASLYTGGVDSSFILRENTPPRQSIESLQIKHVIKVLGADIPLNQEPYFNKLVDLLQAPLAEEGLNLITIRSNVRALTEGLVKWDYSHGSALLSTGVALSGLIGRLIIASSYNYRNLIPWGSSPLLDHLASTETLEVIHYGASMRRSDKVREIADWKIAHGYLRVCNGTGESGDVNCERCDKCLGTKALLDLEGSLKKFSTFSRPFSHKDLLRWAWVCHPKTVIPKFVLRQSILKKRWDYVPFVMIVLIFRNIKFLVDSLIPSFLRVYIRNRIFPLKKNPFHQF